MITDAQTDASTDANTSAAGHLGRGLLTGAVGFQPRSPGWTPWEYLLMTCRNCRKIAHRKQGFAGQTGATSNSWALADSSTSWGLYMPWTFSSIMPTDYPRHVLVAPELRQRDHNNYLKPADDRNLSPSETPYLPVFATEHLLGTTTCRTNMNRLPASPCILTRHHPPAWPPSGGPRNPSGNG